MNLNHAITALCGVAIGVLIGLGSAALTGDSYDDIRSERDVLLAERDALQGQLDAASPLVTVELEPTEAEDGEPPEPPKPRPAPSQSWGELDALPRFFGPGSGMPPFLATLRDAGVWNPDHYWEIKCLLSGPEAQLNLTAAGDGKIYIMANVTAEEDGPKVAKVVFSPDPLTSDRKKSGAYLVNRVKAIGVGLGLSKDELRRLHLFTALVPLDLSGTPEEAVMYYSQILPENAAGQFRSSYLLFSDEDAGRWISSDVPTIGLRLSDSAVVDLLFGSTIECEYDTGYLKFGPWWSLVITKAPWQSSYSGGEPSKFDLAWPQVSAEDLEQRIQAIAKSREANR